jgi:hypothetical protein
VPPPLVYSEALFADYLVTVLDSIATVLGWDTGSPQVQEAVADALLDLGSTSIASVTDIRGLRAVGRRAIWRAVVQATAGNYSITDNGQKLERQQVNDQARKMLELVEADCQTLGVGLAGAGLPAFIWRIDRPRDPYDIRPEEERVIA